MSDLFIPTLHAFDIYFNHLLIWMWSIPIAYTRFRQVLQAFIPTPDLKAFAEARVEGLRGVQLVFTVFVTKGLSVFDPRFWNFAWPSHLALLHGAIGFAIIFGLMNGVIYLILSPSRVVKFLESKNLDVEPNGARLATILAVKNMILIPFFSVGLLALFKVV